MSRHTWRLGPSVRADVGLPVPDPSQALVVAHDVGHALVLGAAGTGKTTTIVAAVMARIAEGQDPESILVFVGGRDAARELRERLALLLRDGAAPRVATFHSFALDFLTRVSPEAAPVLLSGAEQESAVREIIDGTLADSPQIWPDELREAVPTRAFAKEARAAFAAARALGIAGDEIGRMGRAADDAAWQSIGPVLDLYLETQDRRGTLDYAELMFRTVAWMHDARNASLLQGIATVYVDSFEETDVMQLALLRALAPFARSIVVMADPDASVFAFRGAEPRNIVGFTQSLGASTYVLRTCHRHAAQIRAIAVDVFDDVAISSLSQIGIDTSQYRVPQCTADSAPVAFRLYDDVAAEAAHVVSGIRSLVPAGGGWDGVAVIGRSASQLQAVQRACQRAGVPARLDVRSGRLADEPAVRTLLQALAAVAHSNLTIEPTEAHALLVSPLCGLDPSDIRGLARALRADRTTASDQALADALMSERPAFELDERVRGAAEFERLRLLLHRVHARVRAGCTPHEALWLLWEGSGWPDQLQRAAVVHAAAAAHRDLDAVCELFDIADRSVQRQQGRAGVQVFVYELLAQEVPSETLALQGYTGPSVSLVTAHATKGREWPHVFVVGVNEGAWPDLRRRASLLDTDRLTKDGLAMGRSRQAVFDEERRLFHVACTRASASLTVSGLVGDRNDAVQPSRFLMNRNVRTERVAGRPVSLDAPQDLVAALRRIATSATATPSLRDAAISRLHAMAALTDDAGDPLFREADPLRWWGARSVTENAVPIQPEHAPLYVRGSSLDLLTNCALEWFLTQRASADAVRGTALVFGSAIHALAQGVATGELPPDAAVLEAHLAKVWNAQGYDAEWQSRRDFEAARSAIARLLAWHSARAPERVAAEVAFDSVVTIPTPTGGAEKLRMRGSVDRIEVYDDGSVAIFDLKTGRSKFTKAQVTDSGQLRYYQFAHAQGLLDLPAGEASAAFVHLRLDAASGSVGRPAVQDRPPMSVDDPWVTEVLGASLALVRNEAFEATPGTHCTHCACKAACPARNEGRVETS